NKESVSTPLRHRPASHSSGLTRKGEAANLSRLTGLRLSRLASTSVLCVVLGLITTLTVPTSAQSAVEQISSASEQTKEAMGAGKDLLASTMNTVDHINSTKDKSEATRQDEANPWGPVLTEKASWANVAPALLPYFNNGPVFGVPGTDVSDFWHRTQLSGD